jgi:hypothetical protein
MARSNDMANIVSQAKRVGGMVITVKAPMACYIWSTASDLWHPSAAEGTIPIGNTRAGNPGRVSEFDLRHRRCDFNESYILNPMARNGLVLEGLIVYGTWSGRAGGILFPDIMLIARPAS